MRADMNDDALYTWSHHGGCEYLEYQGARDKSWCATVNWRCNEFRLASGAWENFPAGITRDEVKAYVLTLWRLSGG